MNRPYLCVKEELTFVHLTCGRRGRCFVVRSPPTKKSRTIRVGLESYTLSERAQRMGWEVSHERMGTNDGGGALASKQGRSRFDSKLGIVEGWLYESESFVRPGRRYIWIGCLASEMPLVPVDRKNSEFFFGPSEGDGRRGSG
uniref:Uncharacterized protein n=1 Tax=Odontella aurita TaxID=265563 RepID=A0A7S4JL26_9STRA|mmetsp:Transcript_48350/g.146062  ORF Transcript_48350/g.146062 Transcript_48350/m.146062 type:complete len:143 (+) Transcript_48350:213-641(+)